MAGVTRSFLFLQGVNSRFFTTLADALSALGHRVYRVNFTVGDLAFWGMRASTSFHGTLARLPAFYERVFAREAVTDIVLFGDCRPIHLSAIAIAKARGLRVHVYEEGYFRPHWVTLERGGVNANSALPRDPAWFKRVSAHRPAVATNTFRASLTTRALYDMHYHSISFWNFLAFPFYRTHRPANSALEYLGWGLRFAKMPGYKRDDAATIRTLLKSNAPFFLLPLQLDGDAQIRDHSPFKNMAEVIDVVLASFAVYAHVNATLVIKNHPLDTGFVDFRKQIALAADKLAVRHRVQYLESGDLDQMLVRARGVVTVNSTVGLAALAAPCPTITLGNPHYNQPGLTFQGGLDNFWREAAAPDADYFAQFRTVLMATTQINGGFYSREGIGLAVKNSLPVLLAERSPLETIGEAV